MTRLTRTRTVRHGVAATAAPLSRNTHLLKWIEKMAQLTLPAAIHWVDGTQQEYDRACPNGERRRLRQAQRGIVARLLSRVLGPQRRRRVEDRTFICSYSKEAAGPTNNWEDPYRMRRKLKELFNGSMRVDDGNCFGFDGCCAAHARCRSAAAADHFGGMWSRPTCAKSWPDRPLPG